MNEGTYNNVVRSNSPFSPVTPSTASSYKTNVNRTKTRKWVEAKTQKYDGDDWGNEYDDDDDDEPEQEPAPSAPPTHPTSRIAALRQQAANTPHQQRAFSQPTATTDSNKPSPSEVRSPSGPPSLHIQTGADPRSRLAGTTSSAQSQSRFPPRESSIIRKEAPDSRDIGSSKTGSQPGIGSGTQPWAVQRTASPADSAGSSARPSQFAQSADLYGRTSEEREKERISTESGRPSVESGYGRTDGISSSVNAIRSSIEQRQRTSIESHNSSDNSRGLKQTLAPVEERKNGPRTLADETELVQGLADQRRLSTSPKLPDVTRMSGFGDDFFSSSGGSSPSARPSLLPVSDSQRTSVAGAKPGPSPRPDNNQRDTTGLYEEKHAPSALEGPKLEPNPKINMPSSDSDLEPKKEDPVGIFQQSVPSRPQLPGTWVSETASAGSEYPTPAEKAEGPGSASLGSIVNPDVSPMSRRHAEPADLEPTTTVKHLPSTQADSEAVANNKTAQDSGENGFNRPTGNHDGAVASKVISSGPGFHPTPQFLPPLKTESPLAPSSATQRDKQDASANDMAPRSSGYNDSPSRSSFAQQSAGGTGSGFTPTAPLNPRRSLAAPAELITPGIQERKSTMSTVDTASPEKESDKLREEIFKSLSASPATTAPDASVVLGSANDGYDPAPGGLTRESTYLSGVYDEYLSQPEEKSLQETGRLLKQGSKLANETTSSPSIQRESSFPDIAPLSPRRSPVQETTRRPRRFSWENSAEKTTQDPAEADPSAPVPSHGLNPTTQNENEPTPGLELGAAANSSALQVQAEGPSPISHQVSQVSSQSPGDLSSILPEPLSPVSLPTDTNPEFQTAIPDISRLSFADEKEKVLIEAPRNVPSTEQHPALSNPIELVHTPSPPAQSVTTAQSASNAKIMAFRDILNQVSIEQRVQKFEETQHQFYSMESGLSNWLSYMQSQPEHGAGITLLGKLPVAQGQTSPSAVQPPTQQPYYQQYLNASNPGAPPAQIGRVPSGSLQHMFTGQPISSFGPSGKEVGAKSKELLQAAGAFGNKGVKSGMKLFNRGKNKLRGTGDKAFF
ncbi:hypothetical protein F4781DRAFT_417969 [Annulohypoxylon bovei var. microspora]|nr:hypothetical protein F4781DRAFT_417969 [Annulohypoxylon bovei var. microspora]